MLMNNRPFGWVVKSPENLVPVEAFIRDKATAEKFLATGWEVTEVAIAAESDVRFHEQNQAYYTLVEHTNTTEQYLDEACELLSEIIKSDEAYRECTDTSSPTGKRIASVIEYVSQFLPEPHESSDDTEQEEWHMNPCNLGHCDVGAACGIAQCNRCGESMSAPTTTEAFERWNATHAPAVV